MGTLLRPLWLLPVLIVLACGEDSDSDSSVLMPLAVNNVWSYRIWNCEGTPPSEPILNYTLALTDTVTIDGSRYYIGQWVTLGSPGGKVVYQQRLGGLFTAAYIDPEHSLYLNRFFRYPVRPGTTYDYETSDRGTLTVTVSEDTVQVPAGRFACLVYEVADTSVVERLWFAPNLGMVRHCSHTGTALLLDDVRLQSSRDLTGTLRPPSAP